MTEVVIQDRTSGRAPMPAVNVADAVAAWAQRLPAAPAVIHGDVVVSYRVFEGMIRRVAARYAGVGWGPGTVVGVTQAGGAMAQLIAMFALARVGAIQVIVPLDDPPTQRAAIAARCGITAIAGARGGVGLDHLPAVPIDRSWLDDRGDAPAGVRAPGGDAPWMIVHTSGTTGAPKAAAITHGMEVGRIVVLPDFFRYSPGDRLASLVPVDFRVTRSVALKCLSMGGTFVTMPASGTLRQALDRVERQRIDVLMATPSQLVDLLPDMPADRPLLPHLRVLRTTAGAMPPAMVAEVRRRISPNLHVDYGTNDAGSIAVATPGDLDRHPDTVGRPFPKLEVEIVDDAGQPVPPDVEGEIRLRGPGVTHGYIGDPDASRRTHRAGWFHPGDRGRIDRDGLLFVTGRTDDIMNVAGRKVAPAEIEAVLVAHPAVAAVVAFALPSRRDQDVPAAAVVLREPDADGMALADALLAHARQRLGPHAPRYVHVVPSLPRDAVGKISRRVLAAELQAALDRRTTPSG